MAFQTVAGGTGSGLKPFSKFSVNETLEGYFTGMSPNKIDSTKSDLLFQVDGNEVRVPRAGKLVYLEQDLEKSGGKLVVGAKTRLTCVGHYTPKGRSFQSPKYKIEQDLADTINTEAATAAQSDIDARIQALKTGN